MKAYSGPAGTLRTGIAALGVLADVNSAQSTFAGDAVRIAGYVEHAARSATGAFDSIIVPFEVVLDEDCRWKIRTIPPNAKINRLEAGHDGTNVFLLAYDGPKKGMGVTRKMDVPNFVGEPRVSTLWLTYASSCFFKTNRDTRMIPPATPGVVSGSSFNYLEPVKFRYLAKFGDAALEVPTHLICIDDNGRNYELLRPYPPPFDRQPFTNVLYQVHEVTNTLGRVFPRLATLTVQTVGWFTPTTNQLVAVVKMEIVTTNVQHIAAVEDFKPPFSGQITLSDQRFYHASNDLEVMYSGDRWLSDSEIVQHPAFKGTRKAQRNLNLKRWAVGLLMAAMLATPVAWYFLERGKQSNR